MTALLFFLTHCTQIKHALISCIFHDSKFGWVINGWWHRFGSVGYSRLFWFSLNQCSAAQQSEPVLLPVLMSSPINDPAYTPDIKILAINYSWDIFLFLCAKVNFHRVDKIFQEVQKSDIQSQFSMKKNIGVFKKKIIKKYQFRTTFFVKKIIGNFNL